MPCRSTSRLFAALIAFPLIICLAHSAFASGGLDTPQGVLNMPFNIEGVEGMRLVSQNTGAGPIYLGIGTTNPTSNLTVITYSAGGAYLGPTSGAWATRIINAGNAPSEDGLSIQNAWANTNSTIFEAAMGWNGTAVGYYPVFSIDGLGDIIWKNYSQSTLAYFNAGDGYVGIGTNAPAAVLDIENTGGTTVPLLQLGYAEADAFDFTRNASTGALAIQGNQTGYNNIVLAPTGGNVGIGMGAPQTALDVNGGIRGSNSALIVANQSCSPEGAIGYDLSGHQLVYCSQLLKWTSAANPGVQQISGTTPPASSVYIAVCYDGNGFGPLPVSWNGSHWTYRGITVEPTSGGIYNCNTVMIDY